MSTVISIFNNFFTFITKFSILRREFFSFFSEFANKLCTWITSKVNESKKRSIPLFLIIFKNKSIPHGLVGWQSMAVENLAFFPWPLLLVRKSIDRWLCLLLKTRKIKTNKMWKIFVKQCSWSYEHRRWSSRISQKCKRSWRISRKC